MSQQLGLALEPTRARRTDPGTSHEAAARVQEFAGEHFRLILGALAVRPGNIYDIADHTGLTHVQVARRAAELADGGKIKSSREEPGPTGRKCRVWELA
jgi:hypothetical protein